MRLYELSAYSDDVIDEAADAITDYSDEQRGRYALQWLAESCPQSVQNAFETWLLKWECYSIQQLRDSMYDED